VDDCASASRAGFSFEPARRAASASRRNRLRISSRITSLSQGFFPTIIFTLCLGCSVEKSGPTAMRAAASCLPTVSEMGVAEVGILNGEDEHHVGSNDCASTICGNVPRPAFTASTIFVTNDCASPSPVNV
jgi:hypothetical protein